MDGGPAARAAGYRVVSFPEIGSTNSEGLRRRGFTPEQILAVRRAYKTIYREGLALEDARKRLEEDAKAEPVLAPLAAFLAVAGRGIVRGGGGEGKS